MSSCAANRLLQYYRETFNGRKNSICNKASEGPNQVLSSSTFRTFYNGIHLRVAGY